MADKNPRRTEIGSRSRTLGFVANPIPEVGDLRFVRLISRFADDLGGKSGRRLLWRPIGHPAQCDEAYEALRSPTRIQHDGLAIKRYRQHLASRGGEDHHLAREYNRRARKLSVKDEDRPCVVFTANGVSGKSPILRIPIARLVDRERQNTLGKMLSAYITEQSVVDVLDDGCITGGSLRRFQEYLDALHLKLLEEIHGDLKEEASGDNAYLRCIGVDGESSVARDEYDVIIGKRKQYNLIVDVMAGQVYCKNGRKVSLAKLTPMQIGIIADLMETRRPIDIRATETGMQCASRDSARNHFYSARSAICDKLRDGVSVFITHRGYTAFHTTYEFAPSDSFKWVVFRPR